MADSAYYTYKLIAHTHTVYKKKNRLQFTLAAFDFAYVDST